jgi:hypothetical protein
VAAFNAFAQALAAPNAEPTPEEVDALNKAMTQSNPNLKTLLLTQEARVMIDQQRANYLNPQAPKPSAAKVVKPENVEATNDTKVIKPKPKAVSQNVAVSAVIIKPDGSSLVRVNNQYNPVQAKGFAVDYQSSTTAGVAIMVQGKTQVVPVGSTLVTGKNAVLPSYQVQKDIQAKAAQKALLKTEETAAKDALKSVQIINATE